MRVAKILSNFDFQIGRLSALRVKIPLVVRYWLKLIELYIFIISRNISMVNHD